MALRFFAGLAILGHVETKPASLAFGWSKAENATNYEIQIDDNPDFSSPEHKASVAAMEYPAPNVLTQGTYYWRVRATNTFGTPGEWSGTATFTVSIPPSALPLLEPADGSKLETTTTPTFKWQAVDNASEYEIQVDDNPDFNPPQDDSKLSDLNFPIPASMPQGSYSWHVRGINTLGTPGDWSETWEFIISIPPATPTLVSQKMAR